MYTPKSTFPGGLNRTPRSGFTPTGGGSRRTSLLAQLGGTGSRRTPISSR